MAVTGWLMGVLFKADWSLNDELIADWLSSYSSLVVELYFFNR